jgi:hypothetical protein
MISEKATRLLMELSIYNEVEEALLEQNKLQTIRDDWTASRVVMYISWGATGKGTYWSKIHTQLEKMERDEVDLDDDVLPVF